MTIDVPIPDEARSIVRAIRVHEDGSIAIHYAAPVSVGGVLADGQTFLGGPYTGPFEIRVEHTLIIEVNRRARRLGRMESAYRDHQLAPAPAPAPLPIARALPPVPGYRDPRPPPPAPIAIARPLDDNDEDGTAQRFRLLELDLPRQLAAAGLCDSCGHADGQHAPACNRCPECGAFDRDTCRCDA